MLQNRKATIPRCFKRDFISLSVNEWTFLSSQKNRGSGECDFQMSVQSSSLLLVVGRHTIHSVPSRTPIGRFKVVVEILNKAVRSCYAEIANISSKT
jgi:hypothetical protein